MIVRSSLALAAALFCAPVAGSAGTFGELSAAKARPPVQEPPAATCPPYCPVAPYYAPPAAEGGLRRGYVTGQPYMVAPVPPPTPYPPLVTGPGGEPGGAIPIWSYGQMTSMSNPYDPWGLSTPFMHVPWSTPLSGWTNATTWNWWRERSGASPGNW
ncbi:hypothetical protein [Rhodovulum sp. P5]|uniref:hypothetical protein n=1 Tax=Rhodovulum sp. P5 TaxID=1564506 RepID=UPI0009D9B6A2|nr:hypothetical protein [Rhodovulum sp. P5]